MPERIKMLAPKPEYHSRSLEAVDDQELPDADPNASQRQALRGLARSLGMWLSPPELVHLAGALEVQANLIRATEEAGER
jgi:hypothetical protein